MLTVKILGTGCSNCKRLEAITRQVVENLDLPAQIILVKDIPSIMSYGVMATPALVVNEKLLAAGRLPSPQEIMGWLTAAV